MPEQAYNTPYREDWDEHDWERFLRRADVRTAKFQELYETLINHPKRDMLIAQEMGWEETLGICGGETEDCDACGHRFECEAYEMLRLVNEPDNIEDDPDNEDLLACFEQVRDIPAYSVSNDFAGCVEDTLREHAPQWAIDEDVRHALFSAQMVPARIAGGHGIGYERDSLCGNIANCKRALRSLAECVGQIEHLSHRGIIDPRDCRALIDESREVSRAVDRWIETLRARIWWR